MRVYEVKPIEYKDSDGVIYRTTEEVVKIELKEMDLDSPLIITAIDMTEEQLNNLPEFDGW
jgi:hypothetical protein